MPARPGLFGKLPAHGDFVRRHLPRSFVGPWDAWLSEGLASVPEARWAPWRFHLAPGAFGPDAVAGVLAPSADAVGRRFPLTLAALGVAGPPPEAWYAALEELAAAASNAKPTPVSETCDAFGVSRPAGLDADALAAALPEAPDTPADEAGSRFWTADGREARPEAGFAALLAA